MYEHVNLWVGLFCLFMFVVTGSGVWFFGGFINLAFWLEIIRPEIEV